MPRASVSANRPWEPVVGYSRAVRVGNIIEVGGTAATDEQGRVLAPGDLYAQTRACLEIIQRALEELGASCEQVVRTRVFLRDITQWEKAGRAHGEFFSEIRPASTFIEASGFLSEEMLVEVEASAILE